MLACAFALANCGRAQPHTKLPVGFMDAPRAEETINGMYEVRGFAVVEDGVREVDIYVDREFSGSTGTGIERKDLVKPFWFAKDPGQGGWEYQLNAYALLPGRHELTVNAVTNSGATRTIGSVFVNVTR